jgi:adenosylmethionine-8-amino-7-oxononanoate aminotransferase
VAQATVALAAYFYRQRGAEATGMEPVMSGSGVVMMPPRLPDVVKTVVQKYQRRIVP